MQSLTTSMFSVQTNFFFPLWQTRKCYSFAEAAVEATLSYRHGDVVSAIVAAKVPDRSPSDPESCVSTSNNLDGLFFYFFIFYFLFFIFDIMG